MFGDQSLFMDLKAVSEESLAYFDAVCTEVEDEVIQICMTEDDPQSTMGSEAQQMIRKGLGFVTRMLRAAMRFAAGEILENELEWGKTRLPIYGVSAKMVMANFERYSIEMKKRLPVQAYAEIKPYLDGMIIMQQHINQRESGND